MCFVVMQGDNEGAGSIVYACTDCPGRRFVAPSWGKTFFVVVLGGNDITVSDCKRDSSSMLQSTTRDVASSSLGEARLLCS